MLKNNIEVDVKIKCIEAGKTQAQLGEMIGSTGQYVNRIIKKGDGVMSMILSPHWVLNTGFIIFRIPSPEDSSSALRLQEPW